MFRFGIHTAPEPIRQPDMPRPTSTFSLVMVLVILVGIVILIGNLVSHGYASGPRPTQDALVWMEKYKAAGNKGGEIECDTHTDPLGDVICQVFPKEATPFNLRCSSSSGCKKDEGGVFIMEPSNWSVNPSHR